MCAAATAQVTGELCFILACVLPQIIKAEMSGERESVVSFFKSTSEGTESATSPSQLSGDVKIRGISLRL